MEHDAGIHVSAAGFSRIAPGTSYPPGRHPTSHDFRWEQGRTLSAFQFVWISAGSGEFETRADVTRRVTAGDCFLLLPGVWHRYHPDRRTGWTEQWFELRGPNSLGWLQAIGIIGQPPHFSIGDRKILLRNFTRFHEVCREKPRGHRTTMVAYALAILGEVIAQRAAGPGDFTDSDTTARQALRQIAGNPMAMPGVHDLARHQGVSYAIFYRRFLRATGLSPKAYLLQIRMSRAEDLLASSQLSVKEIAALLGFHSAVHLSQQFKNRHGVSPAQWRSEPRAPAN